MNLLLASGQHHFPHPHSSPSPLAPRTALEPDWELDGPVAERGSLASGWAPPGGPSSSGGRKAHWSVQARAHMQAMVPACPHRSLEVISTASPDPSPLVPNTGLTGPQGGAAL